MPLLLLVARFSALFSWYQKQHELGIAWTRCHGPSLLLPVAVPLSMMGGQVRPVIVTLCVVLGLYLFYRNLFYRIFRRPDATR